MYMIVNMKQLINCLISEQNFLCVSFLFCFLENAKSLKAQISRALVDLHILEWFSKIELSSKGKKYYLFKQDLNKNLDPA